MATDPAELKKQLEALNDEFNKINKTITSLTATLGAELANSLRKSNVAAEELSKSFGKGENITKKLKVQIDKNKEALEKSYLKEIDYTAQLSQATRKKDKEELQRKLIKLGLERKILFEMDTQLRTLEKMNDEYQKQNNVFKFTEGKFKDFTKSFKEMFSIAGLFKILIDSAFRFSKISTDIGKNIGYGAAKANEMTNRMAIMAQGSSDMNVTLQNAADAMNEISTATGFVAEYSADTLQTQIMLTKEFGLQADEAANIYSYSVLTGKAASQINDEMVGAFVATRNQLRVGVPFKATIAEAAKVSGQLAANLQNSPTAIVKAVVAAKALGTTLEQTKAQGESLLNFESSIENELKAELITGEKMNLERARAAALAGDQVSLAQELSNQGMNLEKFQSMNVIAQKAYAEALGLSADQLADQLKKQKLAIESGKSLAQLTKEDALEAQKRQDAQTKFNNAVTKLQDLIGNVVAGPLGQLLEMLGDVLNVVGKITASIQEAFGSTAAKVFLGALAGLAVGGPIGAIVGGSIGLLSGAFGDDVAGYGARTLITPQGAVALNNNDTVIAGTNLFKGDDVMSFPKGALGLGGADLTPMINAINEVKTAVNALTNRPVIVNIDGKQVGTSLVQNTYKLA